MKQYSDRNSCAQASTAPRASVSPFWRASLVGALPLLAATLGTSGCTLKSSDQYVLSVNFPKSQGLASRASTSARSGLQAGLIGGVFRTSFDPVPPTSIQGFQCFGLNVRGSGIFQDQRIRCSQPTVSATAVPAPTATSTPVPTSTSGATLLPPPPIGILGGLAPVSGGIVDIIVPGGPDRLIQLIGVQTNGVGCPSLDALLNEEAARQEYRLANGGQEPPWPNPFENIGEPYLLGEARADVFGDTQVTIRASYDPNNPVKMFDGCHGGGDDGGISLPMRAFKGRVNMASVPSPTPTHTPTLYTPAATVPPTEYSSMVELTSAELALARTDVESSPGASGFLHSAGGGTGEKAVIQLWFDITGQDLASMPMAQLRLKMRNPKVGGSCPAPSGSYFISSHIRDFTGSNWLYASMHSEGNMQPWGWGGMNALPPLSQLAVAKSDGHSYVIVTLESNYVSSDSTTCASSVEIAEADLRIMPSFSGYDGSHPLGLHALAPTVYNSGLNRHEYQVATGSSLSFAAHGGIPPYQFSVVNCGGTTCAMSGTGVFTTSGGSGTATIRVTDSSAVTFDSYIQVVSLAAAARFQLTADGSVPNSLTSGECYGPFTVTRLNIMGSPVNPATSQPFHTNAYNTALMVPAGAQFFSDAGCTANLGGSPSIAASTFSSNFYMRPGLSGPTNLEIQDPGAVLAMSEMLSYAVVSDIAQMAAGGMHTCAKNSAGGVKCWGDNLFGGLGDGTTIDRYTPTQVSGLTGGAIQIALGANHSCAAYSGNIVKCWGKNNYGQLGDNTGVDQLTPVVASGVGSAVNVAVGANHTCALTTAGGVQCWGWNNSGQVGDNTTVNRLSSTSVMGLLSGVSQVVAGNSHTCALTTAGGVKCWGNNTFGQLGDNSNTTRYAPTDVSGLSSGIIQIAAGGTHTCALTNTGGVKCWGRNTTGQIGDGSGIDRILPTFVSGLNSGVTDIEAGDLHSCAILSGGAVKCWGDNAAGQLGDGTSIPRNTPINVTGLASGINQITAGGGHTCALTLSGGMKCWGQNTDGQIGNGSNTTVYTPVDVF